MTKKNFKNIKNATYEQLSEMLLWSQLSDEQKQQVLLNSKRLADREEFL